MGNQIITIAEIRTSAHMAALAGQSKCPDKYLEYEDVWRHELKVALYELKQVATA